MLKFNLPVKGISFFCLWLFVACGNDQNKPLSAGDLINNPNSASGKDSNMPLPILVFEEPEVDFGTVEAGVQVKHTFAFKNEGKAPLIISGASASCGCTVPSYPKDPIAPGKSGEVTVVFDTQGKAGKQHKVVTITSNTNPSHVEIALKGLITIASTEGK